MIRKGTDMGLPTVDVIIPTYKPDKTFCLLLQGLQEQTFLIHKLIIMNTETALWHTFINDCGQITDLLATAPFQVEIIHIAKAEFDHGGTRRQAVMHSDSDFFICMTQDARLKNKHVVEELIKPFHKDSKIFAVYARQLPNEECGEVERFTRAFNYPPRSCVKSREDKAKLGIKTFFCSNVCAAYRRSIYMKLGGFAGRAIFNEDMIFAGHGINAGYYVCYTAQAQVIHSHNYTGMQQLKRNFDLAVSQKEHPEVFAGVNSESEGIRMVKLAGKHLLKIGKPWLIVDLVFKSGCKFIGYKLGCRYQRLSKRLIGKLSMNQDYWFHVWRDEEEK